MADRGNAKLAELVANTFACLGCEGVDFRPCAVYIEGLDTTVIVYEDCSHMVEPIPGSNLSLIRRNDLEGKVVGVEIPGWSKLIKRL